MGGGGPEYILPRKVARILGGANARNWKRNTIIYMCTVFPISSYLVFRFSAQHEVRYFLIGSHRNLAASICKVSFLSCVIDLATTPPLTFP